MISDDLNADITAKSSGSEIKYKRYEIKEILNAEHIKHLKVSNQWPEKFMNLDFGTGISTSHLHGDEGDRNDR
jgi:hypothetical protein